MGQPERTPDGRYLVIGGRRWRATDPAIPDALRAELVAELMAARRLVRTDPATGRPRVGDAKVALGERGEPWWDPPTAAGRAERLAAAMRALLRHRAADATICPSDAARAVGGSQWRSEVPAARSVAAELAAEGVLEWRQRGARVEPGPDVRGPIRLARGPSFPA